jgi:pyruvate kinase
VKVLNRVAMRIERSGGAGYAGDALLEDARQKTIASAVVLANSLRNSKLIVFTRHGTMARYVSNLRPQRAPIFAFTSGEEVYRQLAINWGTFSVRIDFAENPNETIESAEKFLRKNKLALPGDRLVIISDILAEGSRFDCVQLRTAK